MGVGAGRATDHYLGGVDGGADGDAHPLATGAGLLPLLRGAGLIQGFGEPAAADAPGLAGRTWIGGVLTPGAGLLGGACATDGALAITAQSRSTGKAAINDRFK